MRSCNQFVIGNVPYSIVQFKLLLPRSNHANFPSIGKTIKMKGVIIYLEAQKPIGVMKIMFPVGGP